MLVETAGMLEQKLHWRSAKDRRTELFQSLHLTVKTYAMMMMNRCSEACTPWQTIDDEMTIMVMKSLELNYVTAPL